MFFKCLFIHSYSFLEGLEEKGTLEDLKVF